MPGTVDSTLTEPLPAIGIAHAAVANAATAPVPGLAPATVAVAADAGAGGAQTQLRELSEDEVIDLLEQRAASIEQQDEAGRNIEVAATTPWAGLEVVASVYDLAGGGDGVVAPVYDLAGVTASGKMAPLIQFFLFSLSQNFLCLEDI